MTHPDQEALASARAQADAFIEAQGLAFDTMAAGGDASALTTDGESSTQSTQASADVEASALLDDDLKAQVMAEFKEALKAQSTSAAADGSVSAMADGETTTDPLSNAIRNDARDALINRLMDLFFKNAGPETRTRICGAEYEERRGEYKFWTEVASIGLSALPLLAGAIAIATLPVTIAAVALALAKYSQDTICTVKMPEQETASSA
ncbi:hypothetical protein [Deinococcus sp. RM]|uniref:hypothetical protein n=1 Tax=Deinococcus sp. RM TaxID=2316359 RepID=UPI000E678B5B|nr:hypothetical protein [Deinococcus sp. RM]RIX96739.1 hypothetical protein D3W47_19740 [Deinococcus sp. RM]